MVTKAKPKTLTVADVRQAKCAAAIFTLDEMARDLLELQTNLKLFCDGKDRIPEEPMDAQDGPSHYFPYSTAQTKAKRILEKVTFIVNFLEHKD